MQSLTEKPHNMTSIWNYVLSKKAESLKSRRGNFADLKRVMHTAEYMFHSIDVSIGFGRCIYQRGGSKNERIMNDTGQAMCGQDRGRENPPPHLCNTVPRNPERPGRAFACPLHRQTYHMARIAVR